MKKYNSIYRGTVIYNIDPLNKGRCKLYIRGIYPEKLAMDPSNLPWAEPVESLFGGSWTNERSGDLNSETGVTTIPHTSVNALQGAQVWVFFEGGNPQYPKYFAACQGGDGWHSEHNNQHVIKTDNVRIRVDENPNSNSSTCKFDTYNTNCTHLSKKKAEQQVPTRVDVEIWNEGSTALNLIIKGNVNMKIEGNVYEQIEGDKHETLVGNLYRKHVGDIHYVHEGDEVYEHTGKFIEKTKGNKTSTVEGNIRNLITGDDRNEVLGNSKDIVQGQRIRECYGGELDNVTGQRTEVTIGDKMTTTIGPDITFANQFINLSSEDIVQASIDGNIYIQTLKDGGTITEKAMTVKRVGKTSVSDAVDYSGAGGTITHTDTAFVNTPEFSA